MSFWKPVLRQALIETPKKHLNKQKHENSHDSRQPVPSWLFFMGLFLQPLFLVELHVLGQISVKIYNLVKKTLCSRKKLQMKVKYML